MPTTPIFISGIIKDSENNNANDAVIIFTGSSDSKLYKTDTDMTIEGITLGGTDVGANDSVYFKIGDTGTRCNET